jgi:hypothetical protein
MLNPCSACSPLAPHHPGEERTSPTPPISRREYTMVEVTIMILLSDHPNDAKELATLNLPGVPRVSDTVIAKGALFEVRGVTWSEELVSLTCYSTTYGYGFPVENR